MRLLGPRGIDNGDLSIYLETKFNCIYRANKIPSTRSDFYQINDPAYLLHCDPRLVFSNFCLFFFLNLGLLVQSTFLMKLYLSLHDIKPKIIHSNLP